MPQIQQTDNDLTLPDTLVHLEITEADIYFQRDKIETLVSAFYHFYDPNNAEHAWLKKQLEPLIFLLMPYATNSTYSKRDLAKALSYLGISPEKEGVAIEIYDDRTQLLLISEVTSPTKYLSTCRKLTNAGNHVRRLTSRSLREFIILSASLGEPFRHVHHDLNLINKPMIYAAWIFSFIKLSTDLYPVMTYSAGCHLVSKKEKELNWTWRLADQLKKTGVEILLYLIWTVARLFICFGYSKYQQEGTFILFGLGFLKSVYTMCRKLNAYDHLLNAVNHLPPVAKSALMSERHSVIYEDLMQIFIRACYLLGEGMGLTKEKNLMITGGSIILLMCMYSTYHDCTKPNLTALGQKEASTKSPEAEEEEDIVILSPCKARLRFPNAQFFFKQEEFTRKSLYAEESASRPEFSPV